MRLRRRSFPKTALPAHDLRWMASIVAPPLADMPLSDSAARGLQLVSVASQGVNQLTKVRCDIELNLSHALTVSTKGYKHCTAMAIAARN